MNGIRVRLIGVDRRERAYRLRMPFRFGVKTATQGRQAVLRARIALADGREAEGVSAEALGAKWFDKDLTLSDEQNHHQLRRSLELACETYLGAPAATPFELFADNYEAHVKACAALGLNPLIASYGQSLIDRAILDGLCRAMEMSFYDAMQRNLAGLRAHPVAPELAQTDPGRLFANASPADSIDVRHTVGLVDPITRGDLTPETRVDDGLPETLEEVVATYGNRYFKLKVSGNETADLERLEHIASVLDRTEKPYLATLDGNEQFGDAESVAAFYAKVAERPGLARLAASILYVEQPINRKDALARPVDALAARVPVIIDESDGALSAFVEARELGYSGVSSKACKGIYKSIVNHARCDLWNRAGRRRFFMSAEDLTCEPGVAIQQDLALVNLLGLTHVERNAHHYIDGFDSRPESEARAFLAGHPDLYHAQDGRVRLHLAAGKFRIGSLGRAGFGSATLPDFDATEPMPSADWPARADREPV